MSIQVAVRLDDEIVALIDRHVRDGDVPNRAAWLARAAERERFREMAEHDARIYAAQDADPELNGFAEWASAQPSDID